MTGYDPRVSDFGSDRYANLATITFFLKRFISFIGT